MGAGERVQAPPRAEATARRGADRAMSLEGSRMAAGAAVGAWVLVLSLWGAVVGAQNITARIGEPLVLKCKGAPKKPPQQLEWKLNTGRTEAWKVLSPQGGPWDSVARVLPNGSLFLPAVGIQDEGIFRCQAMNRNGKETKSNYRVRVYQIPGKPEIIDSASELTAGVPNKVGTCVSEGSYPAGTLSWHLDGKPLVPNEKGVSVKEETRRHPETGLFTLQSELMVTPARGGNPHPTFSCSFSPGLPRRRALHTAPIQPRVWEPVPLEEVQLVVEPEGGAVAPGGTVTLTCEVPAQPSPQIHWMKDGVPLPLSPSPVLILPEIGPQDQGTYRCVATHPSHGPQESRAVSISIIEPGEEGPTAGSVGGSGPGTLALALGILGGLGTAALLIGVILWQRRRRQGEERKASENQEEEEERAELNQSEEPEAGESGTGGP
ncbi:advanced glycosylation end product-specific receptor isoform X1 [Chlorocebus sabaeus]|nr:PREDICTED: advanced glycosylation end product-specific receptor isoform X1 [Macaca fascicularis]XP_007971201.2 advanced glycosylation end product-specific receptor [Chlorocebus sabaeus]XP_011767090.1 advanced glycosylation end product-specific receptor isoform X1 [Macaca nemestrina]XP_025239270.1 advanced glycosylation end product-specific receptor isoform X3 [Theropithecus gelada]